MLSKILSLFASFLLRITGWKVVGELPSIKKYIVIIAPHTSNWDFFILLLLGIKWQVIGKALWLGKHSIFVSWPGKILRALGGIPVDRRYPRQVIDKTLSAMQGRDELIFALSPEGTRKWTNHWKRGFYTITCKTKLPLALVFLNYRDKKIGIGPILNLTGDSQQDWILIRQFYQREWAKYPQDFSEMRFKSDAEDESIR